MKTKLILVLGLPLLALAGQNRQGAPVTAVGSAPAAANNCPSNAGCPLAADTALAPTTLSGSQLLFAIEEERVAHDLYAAAASKWNNLRVFANIADAESRHEAALTRLAATIGVAPAAAQPGTYRSSDLQHLYDQLIGLINESQTGALRAGALVEETDIADLRRMAAGATDAGSRSVLANLERASGHHLAAFVRNLAALGVTYERQVLAADDLAAMVSAAPGGGPANGSKAGGGRGFRGGR